MSLYDYNQFIKLSEEDYSFATFIMAAMKKADSFNVELLRASFPAIWSELQARYNAPGGVLPDEEYDKGESISDS